MPTKRVIRASAWLTPRELAAALDVRLDYLRREIIPTLPAEIRWKKGGRLFVHGRRTIEAILTSRLLAQARKQVLRGTA